ncbi:MAG: hypothetical protein Q9212_000003 [Teloschistes hypoglaucus]
MDRPSCPFCPFSHANPYILSQHVEAIHPEDHPEDETTHLPRAFLDYEEPEYQGNKSDAPSGYVECHCHEVIALGDLDEHLQLHFAEMENTDMTVDSAERLSPVGFPAVVPRRSKHRSLHKDTKHHNAVKDWVALLLGPGPSSSRSKSKSKDPKNVKRLGKAELGPYAHEDQMPSWLLKQLDAGAQVSFVNQINDDGKLMRVELVANETRGILPILAQLCEQDRKLSKVFLCHPGVQHVFKTAQEGGFCGYRNIQMLRHNRKASNSFLDECHPFSTYKSLSRAPGIGESIQRAEWRLGESEARENTLALLRQVKVSPPITTTDPEKAQTLFISLSIGCEASALNDAADTPVFKQVYHEVERYFLEHAASSTEKVCKTSAPPIYFQHQGHSLTIIGMEIRSSGSQNLLVFDPSFKPSPGIQRSIGNKIRTSAPEKLLKAYRRGDHYLSKHSTFELLKLTSIPHAHDGWDRK